MDGCVFASYLDWRQQILWHQKKRVEVSDCDLPRLYKLFEGRNQYDPSSCLETYEQPSSCIYRGARVQHEDFRIEEQAQTRRRLWLWKWWGIYYKRVWIRRRWFNWRTSWDQRYDTLTDRASNNISSETKCAGSCEAEHQSSIDNCKQLHDNWTPRSSLIFSWLTLLFARQNSIRI